jgi:hypothetical protein
MDVRATRARRGREGQVAETSGGAASRGPRQQERAQHGGFNRKAIRRLFLRALTRGEGGGSMSSCKIPFRHSHVARHHLASFRYIDLRTPYACDEHA